jgi:hypothetical protein
MMRRLALGVRLSFGRVKEPNHKLGSLDEPPDLKNKELDKFRRFFTKSNLYLAGQEHPNFQKNPHDVSYIERNEVVPSRCRSKPEY